MITADERMAIAAVNRGMPVEWQRGGFAHILFRDEPVEFVRILVRIVTEDGRIPLENCDLAFRIMSADAQYTITTVAQSLVVKLDGPLHLVRPLVTRMYILHNGAFDKIRLWFFWTSKLRALCRRFESHYQSIVLTPGDGIWNDDYAIRPLDRNLATLMQPTPTSL